MLVASARDAVNGRVCFDHFTMRTAGLGLIGSTAISSMVRQPPSPKVNEFCTDLENPPPFRMVPDSPFPKAFHEPIRLEYSDLQPLVIRDKTLQEVLAAAAQVASNMQRWEITHEEDKEGRIEGVYTTMFTHHKEDFAIRVAQGSSDTEVVVDMRTRSRSEGGLDGNERITSFFEELKEVLKTE